MRSTIADAWRNSPKAVTATSPASVVPRTATGTRRTTVQMIPALTQAANAAVSRPGGKPWNRSSVLETSAPATVSQISGRARMSAWRRRARPRTYHPSTVARRDGGGSSGRCGSRRRDARSASTTPGRPTTTNTGRQEWKCSASTPPSQIPNTPPNVIPTE